MDNELKSFSQIPRLPEQPTRAITNREKIHIYASRRKEPVVNSPDINWKPIDQVAARVVAPAPWYCQSPQSEPHESNPMRPQDFEKPAKVKSKSMLTEDGYVEDHVSLRGAETMAVDSHARAIKDGVKATESLIDRGQEVIDTIDYLVKQIKGPWAEYQAFVKSAINETREQRIALGTETRLLMQSLKEVRQFFLDDNHDSEMQRLREFVDICERLQALQHSGFLDAIADTILKL